MPRQERSMPTFTSRAQGPLPRSDMPPLSPRVRRTHRNRSQLLTTPTSKYMGRHGSSNCFDQFGRDEVPVTAGARVAKRLFNVAGLGMLFIGYPTGYLISVFATADIGTTDRFGCLIGLTFFLIGAFGVAARRLTDRHGLRDSAPVALLALAIPALAIPLLADRPVALLPLGYLGCLCALELGGNVLATALVCGGLLGVGIAVGLPAVVAILLASQSAVLAVLIAGWARQCAAIRALAAARTREAETAVAAERVRFGRDLHDLVGHT